MIGQRSSGEASSSTASLPVPAILDLCDRLLHEVGRRSHLFAWLRPSGASENWLVVDAYYPGNRLVVVCREHPGEHDHLYAELVPQHGLRLLEFSPGAVGGNPPGAERALAELIAKLGPAPPRATGAIPGVRDGPDGNGHEREVAKPFRERPIARAAAALAPAPPPPVQSRRVSPAQAAAVQRAARVIRSRTPSPRRPVPTAPRTRPPIRRAPIRRAPEHGADAEAVGLVVGLTLVAVLMVEMYLDVAKVALAGGELVLAFGIAIDACARALGTIAAGRAGSQAGAWACVLFGSPAVAAFALYGSDGPISTEPGPLAGLLAVLAGILIAIGLLALGLGL